MFERFTDRGRRVLVLAQEEARTLKHNHIGTEHLLIALVHEGESIAAQALHGCGTLLTVENLRAVTERMSAGVPQDDYPTGHIPFTPRAKDVLENSSRVALKLGHPYIGPEHLLLSLLEEGQGFAAAILEEIGFTCAHVAYVVYLKLGIEPPAKESTPQPVEVAVGEATSDPVVQVLLRRIPGNPSSKVIERIFDTPAHAREFIAEDHSNYGDREYMIEEWNVCREVPKLEEWWAVSYSEPYGFCGPDRRVYYSDNPARPKADPTTKTAPDEPCFDIVSRDKNFIDNLVIAFTIMRKIPLPDE